MDECHESVASAAPALPQESHRQQFGIGVDFVIVEYVGDGDCNGQDDGMVMFDDGCLVGVVLQLVGLVG